MQKKLTAILILLPVLIIVSCFFIGKLAIVDEIIDKKEFENFYQEKHFSILMDDEKYGGMVQGVVDNLPAGKLFAIVPSAKNIQLAKAILKVKLLAINPNFIGPQIDEEYDVSYYERDGIHQGYLGNGDPAIAAH